MREKGFRISRPKFALPVAILCLSVLVFAIPCLAADSHYSPLFKDGRTLEDHRKRKAPPSAVTMREAVERALRHNPSLGSSEAQSKSSEETRKSRRGAFGPRLSMSYSAVKQESKTSPQTSRPPEFGTYAWTVEATQPIFQGLRLLANYQRAALQAESDKASLRQAELSMTADVQQEFLNCLRAEENTRSERDAVARLKDQLNITRAFYEVGLRPRLDVLQAEVDVSQAETTLIEAENVYANSLARLNTLLGYPANMAVAYTGTLAFAPFKLTLEECLNRAYAQRPDLFVAAKAVEIAKKDQMAVQSDYYPQIEAYYSITQRGNSPDLQEKGEGGSRSQVWEVGGRATWNVFQWGTTFFDDRAAGELVRKMKFEEENLKLNVGYDVKSRFLALREAEKRIAVAEKAVAQATESYEAALARYREQVGTNFDVLNASSNLLRAQASLTSARADYLTALAQLYVAMGEFHPDLSRP